MADLFHALNRGVDGRDLFLDSSDYVRFIHNMYEFNDARPANPSNRRQDVGFTKPYIRERLVDIHGWCLMKNHYHLLLSERVEGGISLFLRKLNVGYANYFNERNERKGTLFQSRTKKIVVERDAHFLYILHYIHLNPLDYLDGAAEWRQRHAGEIKRMSEAVDHLDSYRWSSYLDYCGKKNFPSILTTTLFEEKAGDYFAELRDYLQDAENTSSKLTLE